MIIRETISPRKSKTVMQNMTLFRIAFIDSAIFISDPNHTSSIQINRPERIGLDARFVKRFTKIMLDSFNAGGGNISRDLRYDE